MLWATFWAQNIQTDEAPQEKTTKNSLGIPLELWGYHVAGIIHLYSGCSRPSKLVPI